MKFCTICIWEKVYFLSCLREHFIVLVSRGVRVPLFIWFPHFWKSFFDKIQFFFYFQPIFCHFYPISRCFCSFFICGLSQPWVSSNGWDICVWENFSTAKYRNTSRFLWLAMLVTARVTALQVGVAMRRVWWRYPVGTPKWGNRCSSWRVPSSYLMVTPTSSHHRATT